MATIRLTPSTYALSNSQYLTVADAANMYTDTDSTSYGTVTNSRASTTSYYIYLRGFNFSAIPEGSTINSFTIKLKAREQDVSTTSTYRPYLCNNTTTLTGTFGTVGTTATVLTCTGVTATWDTIKGYGSNFGIRITNRRASSGTTGYLYIYGAEILVDYTLPVTTHIVSFVANGGSGTMTSVEVDDGDRYTLPACTFTPPLSGRFGKWLIGSAEYDEGDEVAITADTVVKASWLMPAIYVKNGNSWMQMTAGYKKAGGSWSESDVKTLFEQGHAYKRE